MFLLMMENLFVILCAVLFNQFLIGLAYGWVPITLKKLQDEVSAFKLSDEAASWIVSINELGKISGPVLAPFIIDNIGRRGSTLLVMYLLSLMWPSIFYTRSIYLICVIRFTFGCAHGLFDVLSSIYIAENCSSELRVIIGSVLTIVFTAGIFFETVLATFLNYHHTAIVNETVAFCAFSTIYFCTETPYFLVMKENYREAEKNLAWLLGMRDANDCLEKIKSIEASVQEEKRKTKSLKLLLSSTANARSICIVLSMHVISMMTGSSVIAPYCSMIFSSSDMLSANHYVIMYGTCIFLSACISPLVVLKLNRRTLLIVSFSIIGLSHTCSALLLYFHNRDYKITLYPWLIFTFIALYGIVRRMFGPALYIIRTELLPLSVRAIGGSMVVITSALTGFFMAKTFFPIVAYFGLEVNFFIYASMSILLSFIIYHFLPESRGKSLDDI